MTIRSKLFLFYGLMLTLVLVVGAASIWAMLYWQKAADDLAIVYAQSTLAEKFRAGMGRQAQFGLSYLDGASGSKSEFWRIEKQLIENLSELKSNAVDPVELDHIEGLEETKFELQWAAESIFKKFSEAKPQVDLEAARLRLMEISEEVADDVTALNQYYRSQVEQSMIDASEAGTSALAVIGASVILALVQLMALVFLTQKWLVRPISAVSEATKVISSGDFSIRVAVSGKDEWGNLAQSINKMAVSLKYLQAQLRTQEKFVVLGEAAAYTAHNIQNPLAGIRAAAQVTLNSSSRSQDDITQCFTDIIESVDRLDQWVKRFLSYAKPLELQKESSNLNSEVEQAMSLTYRKFSDMGIEVQSHWDNGLSNVWIDPLLLQQAVSAILSNSFESGGKKVVLKTERFIDDDSTEWAMISVSDNGPGISADLKNRLFNSFATNKKGGTGLGLAQAKKIIDLHGGELSYESTPDKGTTFYIKLPISAENLKSGISERKHGADSHS